MSRTGADPGVVAREQGECGELVLRSRGGHHEIIANGVFLMDTRDGASERLLARAAADRMPALGRMAIGGLGVGFSLAAALAHPRVAEVHVVEREAAVVRWNRTHLRTVNSDALADPRVRVHVADVVGWLRDATPGSLDAICLDVDNGPEWLVTPGNAWLYAGEGIAAARRALAPGGVLAVWSAAPSPRYVRQLEEQSFAVEELPVRHGRGAPDVVVLAEVGAGRRRR